MGKEAIIAELITLIMCYATYRTLILSTVDRNVGENIKPMKFRHFNNHKVLFQTVGNFPLKTKTASNAFNLKYFFERKKNNSKVKCFMADLTEYRKCKCLFSFHLPRNRSKVFNWKQRQKTIIKACLHHFG